MLWGHVGEEKNVGCDVLDKMQLLSYPSDVISIICRNHGFKKFNPQISVSFFFFFFVFFVFFFVFVFLAILCEGFRT